MPTWHTNLLSQAESITYKPQQQQLFKRRRVE
jgi:hypothetical protein